MNLCRSYTFASSQNVFIVAAQVLPQLCLILGITRTCQRSAFMVICARDTCLLRACSAFPHCTMVSVPRFFALSVLGAVPEPHSRVCASSAEAMRVPLAVSAARVVRCAAEGSGLSRSRPLRGAIRCGPQALLSGIASSPPLAPPKDARRGEAKRRADRFPAERRLNASLLSCTGVCLILYARILLKESLGFCTSNS